MKFQVLLVILFSLLTNLNAQDVPQKAKDTNPIIVGESIPNVDLLDVDNRNRNLIDILAEKPSVIIFYRGGWCPYCNMHLSEIADIEQDILDLGYQVIAISPDDISDVIRTIDKRDLKYTILSDIKGELITKMGLAFKADFLTKTYAKAKNKGRILDILPVPAVYVTDTSGKILYKHTDPVYKNRLSGDILIKSLKDFAK